VQIVDGGNERFAFRHADREEDGAAEVGRDGARLSIPFSKA
jgi:hypothetical protein